MKKRTKLSLVLGAVMAVSSCGCLAACGPSDKPDPTPPDDKILNFVAVDGTNWDTDVTFDSKKFKLSLDLNKDKTLKLTGTCGGKAQGGGNQGGGPGGPGGPGGDGGFPDFGGGGGMPGPGGEGGAPAPAAEGEAEEDDTDYSVYNFAVNGSWTEEQGWGYTLKFSDGKDTEIVVNYDKTSGRQYFYYYMTPKIGEVTAAETLVKFEAKDSAYRKTLNANYVINEERNCVYMFKGGQEGGSGNLNTATLYLLPEGKVAAFTGTSNSITYNGKGTWTEDKTAHVISGTTGTTAFATDAYCDTAGREGYRMQLSVASGGPGGGNNAITVYASCDTSKYTWDKYVASDFEGEVVETWSGVDEDGATYELRLTSKNFANVVNESGKTLKTVKYTLAGGVLTMGDWVSVDDTINVAWQVPAPNPFTPAQNYNITFTKPAAQG